MQPLFFAAGSVVATLFGGIAAFRAHAQFRLVLGFGAGVVLGVVGWDLVPELRAFAAANGLRPVALALVVGAAFVAAAGGHLLPRMVATPAPRDPLGGDRAGTALAAMSLIGHSFFDGVSIGLAWQASASIGVAVAVGIISHDLADGMNTVSVMLTYRNTRRNAALVLLADGAAPMAGAVATLFFAFSSTFLAFGLAAITGVLLHLGAAVLLPRALASPRRTSAAAVTAGGVLFAYIASRIVP